MKNSVGIIALVLSLFVYVTGQVSMNASAVALNTNIALTRSADSYLQTILDKGSITASDISVLSAELANTGLIIDPVIQVSRRVVYKNKVEYVLDEIIDKSGYNDIILNNKRIDLNTGDKVSITLMKRNSSISERLVTALNGGLTISQNRITFEGMVR